MNVNNIFLIFALLVRNENIKLLLPPILPIGYSTERTSLYGSGGICFMENLEGFVPIPYSDEYLVNQKGDVFSTRTNKIVRPYLTRGYLNVNFWKNDRIFKRCRIHHLIAISFIDKDYVKKGLVVNHKDGIKTNNDISNLEVVTQLENMRHAHRMGLINSPKGQNHGMAILTEDQVVDIFNNPDNITIREQSKKYNISYAAVWCIRTGKSWSHITKSLMQKKFSELPNLGPLQKEILETMSEGGYISVFEEVYPLKRMITLMDVDDNEIKTLRYRVVLSLVNDKKTCKMEQVYSTIQPDTTTYKVTLI